jgi:hypothetical protein
LKAIEVSILPFRAIENGTRRPNALCPLKVYPNHQFVAHRTELKNGKDVKSLQNVQ